MAIIQTEVARLSLQVADARAVHDSQQAEVLWLLSQLQGVRSVLATRLAGPSRFQHTVREGRTISVDIVEGILDVSAGVRIGHYSRDER